MSSYYKYLYFLHIFIKIYFYLQLAIFDHYSKISCFNLYVIEINYVIKVKDSIKKLAESILKKVYFLEIVTAFNPPFLPLGMPMLEGFFCVNSINIPFVIVFQL